jgi:hypothetical protein
MRTGSFLSFLVVCVIDTLVTTGSCFVGWFVVGLDVDKANVDCLISDVCILDEVVMCKLEVEGFVLSSPFRVV